MVPLLPTILVLFCGDPHLSLFRSCQANCSFSNTVRIFMFLCLCTCSSFYLECFSIQLMDFFFFLIYFFMAVLGLRFCARAFSSCGKWGPLFIAVRGPLTIAASLVAEHRLQTRRLSDWLMGLVAPRHVGSSQTRARTRIPCIGRQILNHCAAREAPS